MAALIRHGVLSHTLGEAGEYEVRTTVDTRRGWQYRCAVFRHGKALKHAFAPIVVDGTQRRQRIHKEPEATDVTWHGFVKEAVEAHFTRCAALREYLMMSMIYAQVPPPSKRRHSLLVLFGVAVLAVYGVWRYSLRTDGDQSPARPTRSLQSAQHPVGDQPQAESPTDVPQRASNGMVSYDSPDEPAHTSPRNGMLKVVQLTDLLTPQAEHLAGLGTSVDPSQREVIRQVQRQLRAVGFHPGPIDGHLGARTEGALLAYQQARHLPKTGRLDELTLRSLDVKGVPEQTDQLRHTSTADIPLGSASSDLHPGDLLLLSGWIQQASRDPDGTYRLQLSPQQKARTPALTAVIPHPDQAAGSPTTQAQLQTVRTFVTAQLLQDQEPSPRGSVMRSPAFVQLSGQLSSPASSSDESSPGKRSGEATGQWEVHPVVEIQFATPPSSSDGMPRP